MHNNLIILAGGTSSRMKNSMASKSLSEEELRNANSSSKALLGFGKNKRPILDFLLLNAEKAGYKNIVIVIGEEGEAFKEYYGYKTLNNEFNGQLISFTAQLIPEGRTKPFGTADALFQAMEQHPKLLKEAFTDADNFGVIYQAGIDVQSKALLLGAVFLIDFVHFETKKNN